jgi:putative peptidoglycan lipid II flippase
VARVQSCYSLQLPFIMLAALLVRFISAMKRNDLLMYCAAICLPLDVVLNLGLMRLWGVAGIALSTSLVSAVSCSFLALCSLRLLAQKGRWPAPAAAQAPEVVR